MIPSELATHISEYVPENDIRNLAATHQYDELLDLIYSLIEEGEADYTFSILANELSPESIIEFGRYAGNNVLVETLLEMSALKRDALYRWLTRHFGTYKREFRILQLINWLQQLADSIGHEKPFELDEVKSLIIEGRLNRAKNKLYFLDKNFGV